MSRYQKKKLTTAFKLILVCFKKVGWEPPEPDPYKKFHSEPEPDPHQNDAAPQHWSTHTVMSS
jgi:hypothetical protein